MVFIEKVSSRKEDNHRERGSVATWIDPFESILNNGVPTRLHLLVLCLSVESKRWSPPLGGGRALKVTSRASIRYDSHGFDRQQISSRSPSPPSPRCSWRVSNTLFLANENMEIFDTIHDRIPGRWMILLVTRIIIVWRRGEISSLPLQLVFSPRSMGERFFSSIINLPTNLVYFIWNNYRSLGTHKFVYSTSNFVK